MNIQSSSDFDKLPQSTETIYADLHEKMATSKTWSADALEVHKNPLREDFHKNPLRTNTRKSQQERAQKHWGKVKAAVKVGTFAKYTKHKKKIAAAMALKITIIVVVLVLVLGAAAAAYHAAKTGKVCKYTGKMCNTPTPKTDVSAAQALQFGTESIIPPKVDSRRRRLAETDIHHLLRGDFARKLVGIDTSSFPEDSEYALKKTTYFVAEEAAESMNIVNMIFCDIAQTRADSFINAGPYKAKIDEGKCSTHGQIMDWTIDAKSVGDLKSCVSNEAEDKLSCGYDVSIWFKTMGDMTIEVKIEVWKPKSTSVRTVPQMKVRYQAGDAMKGWVTKSVDSNGDVDLQFGTIQPDQNEKPFLSSGIHAAYNFMTKNGKCVSSAFDHGTGQIKSWNLAFNSDYVNKKPSGSTRTCLSLNPLKEVGNQYHLYDEKGKMVVFQDGFPIEATLNGNKGEAWVGYYGLHIQGPRDQKTGQPKFAEAFKDGSPVEKINYDAEGSRTKYNLKIADGRLYKISRQTVKLGDLKGVSLQVGHGSDAEIIMYNGSSLVKVGEMSGSCWPYERGAKLNGPTDRKSCHCHGQTSGKFWDHSNYWWKDSVTRVSPHVPYTVDAKKFPWGFTVSAGEGSARFDGSLKLDIEQIAKMYLKKSGNFIKGQIVTQGSAKGTVYKTTVSQFDNFVGCSSHDCMNVTYKQQVYTCAESASFKEILGHRSSWIPEGAILTQPSTGATGVAVGSGHVGGSVNFQTTSGAFSPTGEVIVSSPSEAEGQWQWQGISGKFTPTSKSANPTTHVLEVLVERGKFTNTADVTVNSANKGTPWHVEQNSGKVKTQPGANSVITYATRTLVMPDDTVPSLLCYDNCPKGDTFSSCSGDDCYHQAPSILRDAQVRDEGSGCSGTPTFTFSNIGGSPTMTGTLENGKVVAVELTNPGAGCNYENMPQVTVGGLTCTTDPSVEVSCRERTDAATGPSAFSQAQKYSFDAPSGILSNGGKSVTKAGTSNVHSGVLFEGTEANKNKAKCEHNDAEVCYYDMMRTIDTYYQWETASTHSTRVSLVDEAGKSVKFDQPMSVAYIHSGKESNSGINYDGATILLSYEGELRGFPTFCLNPSTNEPVDCSPYTEQTPDMVVPDNAIFTATATGKKYVAKAGEIKQMMTIATNTTKCDGLNTDSSQMPSSVKMSDFKEFVLKKQPDMSGAVPSVIFGQLLEELAEAEAITT